jgi:hypothetical protein
MERGVFSFSVISLFSLSCWREKSCQSAKLYFLRRILLMTSFVSGRLLRSARVSARESSTSNEESSDSKRGLFTCGSFPPNKRSTAPLSSRCNKVLCSGLISPHALVFGGTGSATSDGSIRWMLSVTKYLAFSRTSPLTSLPASSTGSLRPGLNAYRRREKEIPPADGWEADNIPACRMRAG